MISFDIYLKKDLHKSYNCIICIFINVHQNIINSSEILKNIEIIA